VPERETEEKNVNCNDEIYLWFHFSAPVETMGRNKFSILRFPKMISFLSLNREGGELLLKLMLDAQAVFTEFLQDE
jgi:hypothetical protein